VTGNRPRLAAAALSVLRAYFNVGRPEQAGGQWGSFEGWSRVIRGAVVWSGAADPLPTRAAATANDDSRAVLGLLIAGIEEADPDREGLTTREIERLTSHRPDESPTCPALVAAVGEICGDRFNSRRVGKRVRSYIGRVWEGRQIESSKGHGGLNRWMIREADSGLGSFGGFTQPQSSHRGEKKILPPMATHPRKQKGEWLELNPPPPAGEPSAPCPRCGGQMARLPERLWSMAR